MSRYFSRKSVFPFLLIWMTSCAAPLLIPEETDVVRARLQWSDASMEQLASGHNIYKLKCGSCHYLYRPYQFTEEHWLKELPEMNEKANLNPNERELIRRYILTMQDKNPDSLKAQIQN